MLMSIGGGFQARRSTEKVLTGHVISPMYWRPFTPLNVTNVTSRLCKTAISPQSFLSSWLICALSYMHANKATTVLQRGFGACEAEHSLSIFIKFYSIGTGFRSLRIVMKNWTWMASYFPTREAGGSESTSCVIHEMLAGANALVGHCAKLISIPSNRAESGSVWVPSISQIL